jgi:hypothetical protein
VAEQVIASTGIPPHLLAEFDASLAELTASDGTPAGNFRAAGMRGAFEARDRMLAVMARPRVTVAWPFGVDDGIRQTLTAQLELEVTRIHAELTTFATRVAIEAAAAAVKVAVDAITRRGAAPRH